MKLKILNYIFNQFKLLYFKHTTFLLLHLKPTVQRHAAQLICPTIVYAGASGIAERSRNFQLKIEKLKRN